MRQRVSGGFGRTFAGLSEQQFRLLWFGMLFSMAAMQMDIVARGWLAYDLTGSALLLGVAIASRSLPQLLLAPVGGVAADRFDKRKLLIMSQSSLAAVTLVNAFLVLFDVVQLWHLVVIGAFQGVAQPFTMPTRTALVPHLVPEARISNALALDSTGRNLNRIVAPALAGILIAVNPPLAFFAVSIFYTAATLTLFRLPRGLKGENQKGSPLAEIAVGFRYVSSQSGLLALMIMSFILVILGMPFQQLLPVFQKEVLDVGPRSLGFMFTAVGVGAITGSLLAAFLSDRPDKGRLQLGAGLLFGVSLTAFALSSSYVLSLALLTVVGFSSQSYMTINRLLIMLQTERRLYGRVMSVTMMTWSLVPAVVLPLGVAVDRVGVSATVATCGVVLTLCLAAAAITFPRIYLRPAQSVAASG